MINMKRRSKIQICIEILSILSQRGLSRITHIMYESNTNCSLLKEILVFMKKQGLVEEKSIGKQRIAYCITQKGSSILNTFKEFKHKLPIVEEPQNQTAVIV